MINWKIKYGKKINAWSGTLFIFLGIINVTHCQIVNSKETIKINKVKSEIQSLCIGTCSTQFTEYDKRGNTIEEHLFRSGTIHQYKYDKEDNIEMTLWISRSDSLEIDTLYPKDFEISASHKDYREEYFNEGKLLHIYWQDEKTEIVYNDNCSLIRERRYLGDVLVYEQRVEYDYLHRIIKKATRDFDHLKLKSELSSPGRDGPFHIMDAMIERYVYNLQGQVVQLYTYFFDPCLGLDNHFLYYYFYRENGLLQGAEVFEKGIHHSFTLEYEYGFY